MCVCVCVDASVHPKPLWLYHIIPQTFRAYNSLRLKDHFNTLTNDKDINFAHKFEDNHILIIKWLSFINLNRKNML